MAPSRLAAQLAAGEFAVSVELRPPRGIDPSAMLRGARVLREAGVDYANIPDSPTARLRMGVLSCAALVQQQVGLEAIAHFTTRDRNVMAIQSELMGAHALGIRNVLCLRGDPPLVGDYPNATAVWDVSAVGLVTILANLNRGFDANGAPIGERAAFFVGAAVNPAAEDLDREVHLLQRKLDAGAHFLVTQPIYRVESLERLFARTGDLPVPVLVGIMPLVSLRHAEYLHHEVPGIVIPQELRDELAGNLSGRWRRRLAHRRQNRARHPCVSAQMGKRRVCDPVAGSLRTRLGGRCARKGVGRETVTGRARPRVR